MEADAYPIFPCRYVARGCRTSGHALHFCVDISERLSAWQQLELQGRNVPLPTQPMIACRNRPRYRPTTTSNPLNTAQALCRSCRPVVSSILAPVISYSILLRGATPGCRQAFVLHIGRTRRQLGQPSPPACVKTKSQTFFPRPTKNLERLPICPAQKTSLI